MNDMLPFSPSPALESMADQRLAWISEHLPHIPHVPPDENEFVVLTVPLNFPPEDAGETELKIFDRRCDVCNRYCPDNQKFYVGRLQRWKMIHGGRYLVILTFGLCPDHKPPDFPE